MDKVFMIHGLGGEPNGGWRPWLMRELAEREVYAAALPLPNPAKPTPDEWVAEIAHQVRLAGPDSRIFLVGHSLGVSAILRYLEQLPAGETIAGAVLCAGPYESHDRDEVAAFFVRPFDFTAAKERCPQFAVIHGDKDPVVPVEHGEKLAAALGVELTVIPGAQHLNGGSGQFELPEALAALQGMMA
jgi:predicted alpha/beta hydrolase family esterase